MKRLELAGLYGNGLVRIDTKELVRRYNDCLQGMGIEPTTLESFRVDGVGWSPEVAQEREDLFYLSHGVENPLAVILTPDQRRKPVYISFYSFMRELMDQYFARFSREIADLTSETALHLDLDQGLSVYRKPLDLLLVGEITVRTSAAGELQEAARHQRQLVSRFLEPGEAWFDPALRSGILQSARTHGDLRGRHLFIPETTFADTEVFATKAFGGVFVFRGLASCESLLVFEDSDQMPKLPRGSETRVYAIGNLRWLLLLLEEGVLEIDLAHYKQHPDELARIQDCLLADTICARYPDIDYTKLSASQKKGYINRLKAEIPGTYFELEVLTRQLESGDLPKAEDLSLEVQSLICHPRRQMPPLLRHLLWQLLSRAHPVDVWRVYRHNKELFYEVYNTWPDNKKEWAVALLRDQLTRRREE